MHETKVLESEQVLGGYDYDELSESLATRPMGSDIYESSYKVLSLMSSMEDTQDEKFALVVKESEGSEDGGRAGYYVALQGGRGCTDVAGSLTEAGNR